MKNILYCGDNLEVLRKEIPEESVDLIYIDPPSFSHRHMEGTLRKVIIKGG